MARNEGELRKVQTGRAGSVDKNGVARRATMTTVIKRVGGGTETSTAGMRGGLSAMAGSESPNVDPVRDAMRRLDRAQVVAGRPRSSGRSGRAVREVVDASMGVVRALADETPQLAKEAPIGELAQRVNSMAVHYELAVTELEYSGAKPDRATRRLGRQLRRLENKIGVVRDHPETNIDYHSQHPRWLGASGSMTERTQMEDLCRKVAATAKKVKESNEPLPQVVSSTPPAPSTHVNSDGVPMPSPEQYEEAAAILGRGFDSEMTKYEMEQYRKAGVDPPDELRRHHSRVTRNPYEDF